MVDSPNVNPKGGNHSPTPPDSQHQAPQKKHPWNPKPLTWLGMQFDVDETKKLWSIISQTIGTQIEHEKDKAIAALKKLDPNNSDND